MCSGFAAALEREVFSSINRHLIEDVVAGPPIAKVWIRCFAATPVGYLHGQNTYESLWVGKRQRAQQHSIHRAEDGRIRANPKRKGENGDGGEAWIAAELAEAVAEVLPEFLEQARAQCFPALFLVILVAAKLDARLPLGLTAGNSLPLQVRHAQGKVRAELLVHLALDAAPVEQEIRQRAQP